VRGGPAAERVEPREWRGDLFWWRCRGGATTWSTAPSAVFPCGPRPLPMPTPGLPHRTTRSVSAQRDGVRSSTPSGRTGRSATSWDKLENLCGPRWSDGMRHSHHVVAPTVARGPIALPPAPSRSHPGTVDRALFRGREARARRCRELATDRIHQPPRGGWGLLRRGESNPHRAIPPAS
jgi:hypothetical protein